MIDINKIYSRKELANLKCPTHNIKLSMETGNICYLTIRPYSLRSYPDMRCDECNFKIFVCYDKTNIIINKLPIFKNYYRWFKISIIFYYSYTICINSSKILIKQSNDEAIFTINNHTGTIDKKLFDYLDKLTLLQ